MVVWIIAIIIIVIAIALLYNVIKSILQFIVMWRYHIISFCVLMFAIYSVYKWKLTAVYTIIAITVISFICYHIDTAIQNQRRNEYAEWLENVGIGKLESAPGTQKERDWAVEQEKAYIPENGYVISITFLEKILNYIDQQNIITKNSLQEYCHNVASSFQDTCTGVLIDLLKSKKIIIKFSVPERKTKYLTKNFINECQTLHEIEGGRTVKEFAEICSKSPITSCVCENYNEFAKLILNHLVSCGAAYVVSISNSELGNELFLPKKQRADSKMIRHEIILD